VSFQNKLLNCYCGLLMDNTNNSDINYSQPWAEVDSLV